MMFTLWQRNDGVTAGNALRWRFKMQKCPFVDDGNQFCTRSKRRRRFMNHSKSTRFLYGLEDGLSVDRRNGTQIDELDARRQSGMSIVPLRLLTKGRYIKLVIALGKGKKNYDKRQVIKQRDQARDTARSLKI